MMSIRALFIVDRHLLPHRIRREILLGQRLVDDHLRGFERSSSSVKYRLLAIRVLSVAM